MTTMEKWRPTLDGGFEFPLGPRERDHLRVWGVTSAEMGTTWYGALVLEGRNTEVRAESHATADDAKRAIRARATAYLGPIMTALLG